MASARADDIDEFVDRVDDVAAAISGLKDGTLDIGETDKLLKTLEAGAAARAEKKKENGSDSAEQQQEGMVWRSGSGWQSDSYQWFCKHCSLEYEDHGSAEKNTLSPAAKPEDTGVAQPPPCTRCKKRLVSSSERQAELQAKVDALKEKRDARRERRQRFVDWKHAHGKNITGGGAAAKGATDYAAWDFWEPSSDDDQDSFVPPDDPAFVAMEADIERRAEKRRKASARAQLCKEKGNASMKKGDIAAALQHYSEGIELKRDEKALYTNRALVHLKRRDYEAAAKDCSTVVEIVDYLEKSKPRLRNKLLFKALMRRAEAYRQMDRYEDAIRDLEEAAKVIPGHKECATMLSNVLSEKNNYKSIYQAKSNSENDVRGVATVKPRSPAAANSINSDVEAKFSEQFVALTKACKLEKPPNSKALDEFFRAVTGASSSRDHAAKLRALVAADCVKTIVRVIKAWQVEFSKVCGTSQEINPMECLDKCVRILTVLSSPPEERFVPSKVEPSACSEVGSVAILRGGGLDAAVIALKVLAKDERFHGSDVMYHLLELLHSLAVHDRCRKHMMRMRADLAVAVVHDLLLTARAGSDDQKVQPLRSTSFVSISLLSGLVLEPIFIRELEKCEYLVPLGRRLLKVMAVASMANDGSIDLSKVASAVAPLVELARDKKFSSLFAKQLCMKNQKKECGLRVLICSLIGVMRTQDPTHDHLYVMSQLLGVIVNLLINLGPSIEADVFQTDVLSASHQNKTKVPLHASLLPVCVERYRDLCGWPPKGGDYPNLGDRIMMLLGRALSSDVRGVLQVPVAVEIVRLFIDVLVSLVTAGTKGRTRLAHNSNLSQRLSSIIRGLAAAASLKEVCHLLTVVDKAIWVSLIKVGTDDPVLAANTAVLIKSVAKDHELCLRLNFDAHDIDTLVDLLTVSDDPQWPSTKRHYVVEMRKNAGGTLAQLVQSGSAVALSQMRVRGAFRMLMSLDT